MEPSCVFVWSNCSGTMSLLRYFSIVSADHEATRPQRALARDMPLSAISAANTEVKRMQNEQQPTPKLKPKRELYTKLTDGQKVKDITKRAAEHRIASTIRYFAMKYPHLN